MKKLMIVSAIFILSLLSGCGGGEGGSTAAPVNAKLKLSSAGALNAGEAVSGFSATIEMPTGVSVKTASDGSVDSTVVTPSGLLGGTGNAVKGPVTYTPASGSSKGKLDFSIASASTAGVGVGEYVTVTFTLNGVSPTVSDFTITSFKPVDMSYADLTTLTPDKSVTLN